MLLAQVWPSAARADVSWSPLDDRWYSGDVAGMVSGNDTGVYLSADTIFRCSTVLAAIRFKAQAVAVCSPQAFIHLPGGRRQADPEHYSQQVLRQPNESLTSFEWTSLNVTWFSTWGNAYNRIVGGARSFVEELRPMHPSRVRVLRTASGARVYEYRPQGGEPEVLGEESVLHYMDLSLDGVSGLPMYQLIRNAVGIALLAERHVASFLRKGSRLAGVLVPEAPTNKAQQDELKATWNTSFGGPDKTGTVGLLPYGVKFQALASDNQKGQIVELSNQAVESILRFLGVPGVVVGYADKTATYASAKEFFESGGVKHCILPLVTNMEQRDEKALLLRGDPHYIKRNLDVLQRANTKDRFAALVQATGGPFMSVNEARAIEDMNPDPDPLNERVRWPANVAGKDTPTDPTQRNEDEKPPAKKAPKPAPPDDDEADARAGRLHQFATDAAARAVRREIAAIRGSKGSLGASARYAKDPAGFRAWVTDFYDKHAGYVMETVHVAEEVAIAYAIGQRDALLTHGVGIIETWEETVVPQLAALALGE